MEENEEIELESVLFTNDCEGCPLKVEDCQMECLDD